MKIKRTFIMAIFFKKKKKQSDHLNKSILNKNLNYPNPDYINNNELVHFAIWHTFVSCLFF